MSNIFLKINWQNILFIFIGDPACLPLICKSSLLSLRYALYMVSPNLKFAVPTLQFVHAKLLLAYNKNSF